MYLDLANARAKLLLLHFLQTSVGSVTSYEKIWVVVPHVQMQSGGWATSHAASCRALCLQKPPVQQIPSACTAFLNTPQQFLICAHLSLLDEGMSVPLGRWSIFCGTCFGRIPELLNRRVFPSCAAQYL